ncbi:MAG: ABC transporter permease [Phycisphaeraceae bacterium]|jgi:putative ABC transport system permease protein|nr:ABC transporter permease [Phycisphaeraceae bacterium]
MIAPKFIPVVVKQLWRHRVRSVLTLSGVAIAMFLFIAVQTLQEGVRRSTQAAAGDTTLVVYRENRFCPAASRLPQFYVDRIEKIPGVVSAVPVKIVVNNCRASLDVVTFRGVPREELAGPKGWASKWQLIAGSVAEWEKRSDSALVGETLAARRGFQVGQSFDASGITVTVAGIIRSPEAQDQNVAYVHLDFLQQAAGKGGGLGSVTQFTVRVDDPAKMEQVAEAIDAEFRTEADPTMTSPEKAFVAQAGADIVEIVKFTQWLGWGCLAAVLALVANAIVLSVQDRIKEHAVLQTLGFRSSLIARLIVSEGMLIGVLGGAIGTVIALSVVHFGNFSLSQEGLSIGVSASWSVLVWGLIISAGVGIVAGLVPAWRAGRREIASCFRAV